MNQSAKANLPFRGVATSKFLAASVLVSLTVNAGLLAVLAYTGPRMHPGANTRGGHLGPELARPPRTHTVAASRDAAAPPDLAPAFNWQDVESEDYTRYIANLRSIGCPEPLIQDLIAARLNQYYTPLVDAKLGIKSCEYWQKEEQLDLTAAQRKWERAIRKERDQQFEKLLGVPFSKPDHFSLTFFQVNSTERELLFLSDDKRQSALRILTEVQEREQELTATPKEEGGNSQDPELQFKEKLKALAGVLTPGEIEEFRLRNSPAAQDLRGEILFFDCTPEEFSQLLDARGKLKNASHPLNRKAEVEVVRELFGEQRAQDYEKNTDIFYMNARSALERAGLAAELADEAWRICQEARVNADQVALNTALSGNVRRDQIRRLDSVYQQMLTELMGERVSQTVRMNLSSVWQMAEARIKP